MKFIRYASIWVIALSIGLYIRLYPLRSYATNTSSEKATLAVVSQIRTMAKAEVASKFPDAPLEKKVLLEKKVFDALLRSQKEKVQKTISILSQKLDSEETARSYPYLLASDPYYYYGLTEQILNTGTLSDEIKGSKFLHKLMLAPDGKWVNISLHPYIGLGIHRFLHIFDKDVPLMYSVSFTPLAITALALIPFLGICAILGCSLPVTFTSAIFFLLSPIFVKRSTFGWYDNDPHNILFPLLILLALFASMKVVEKKKTAVIPTAMIIALLFTLYSLFWQGWVFLCAVIVAGGILVLMYDLFVLKRKETTAAFAHLFCWAAAAIIIIISLIFGIGDFITLFTEGWRILSNFLTPRLSEWPDILMSVGELKKSSLQELITLSGGYFFFIISSIGFLATIASLLRSVPRIGNHVPALLCANNKTGNTHEYPGIFIAVFFIVSLILTLGAERFALLFIVPTSILFAIGLQFLTMQIISTAQQRITAGSITIKKIPIAINGIVIGLSIIAFFTISIRNESLLNRIYNDTWDTALKQIEEKTPENSVMNAWWPPGHFIKAIAHRSVIFDGGSIDVPQSYWLANAFLATDEREALGILRMLDTAGNKAAEYLHDTAHLPLSVSVQILKEVITKNETDARRFLKNGFATQPKVVDMVIDYTHRQPPPAYVFLYKEFVDNNAQLDFFGRWNFRAIEEINKNRALLKKIPAPNTDEYITFLWKLVGGRHRYSDVLAEISRSSDGRVLFDNNVTIDTKKMFAHIASPTYGIGIPYSIFYINTDVGKVVEKTLVGANLTFSIVLIQNADRHQCILMDRALAQSFLIQLFFFDGVGLSYCKPIIDVSDLTKRNHIKVFEINWEAFGRDMAAGTAQENTIIRQ